MTDERLVSAAEAARILGLPIGTIHSWASRKLLIPKTIIDAGRRRSRPLYVLAEVEALAEGTRRRDGTSLTDRTTSA